MTPPSPTPKPRATRPSPVPKATSPDLPRAPAPVPKATSPDLSRARVPVPKATSPDLPRAHAPVPKATSPDLPRAPAPVPSATSPDRPRRQPLAPRDRPLLTPATRNPATLRHPAPRNPAMPTSRRAHLSFRTALALLLLAAPAIARAAAPTLRLEPLAADDLAAPAVVASRLPAAAPPGGPVRFTWPIDQASDDLAARPAPHSASATGHAQTVTAAALRRGVPLAISGPGAFLKLSPAARDIQLLTPDGHPLRPGAGLRAIGRDGLAFTLDPAAGPGRYTLRAEADTPVRVDLLERGSDLVLVVQAARDVAFVGDTLRVEARLLHRGRPVPAGQLQARLVAPDGHVLTRAMAPQRDGSHAVNLPVRGEPDARPWSIEVELDATIAGRPVRRTTTTAVAVSVPTARLTGAATLTRPGDGLRAELELEVASDSRYAVSAVLHGHNRDGQLQPIAVGQSAAALTPGQRSLALEFDAKLIADSGLRGPFELHDLRLVDQGRMFVLHRQARALAPLR